MQRLFSSVQIKKIRPIIWIIINCFLLSSKHWKSNRWIRSYILSILEVEWAENPLRIKLRLIFTSIIIPLRFIFMLALKNNYFIEYRLIQFWLMKIQMKHNSSYLSALNSIADLSSLDFQLWIRRIRLSGWHYRGQIPTTIFHQSCSESSFLHQWTTMTKCRIIFPHVGR